MSAGIAFILELYKGNSFAVDPKGRPLRMFHLAVWRPRPLITSGLPEAEFIPTTLAHNNIKLQMGLHLKKMLGKNESESQKEESNLLEHLGFVFGSCTVE